MATKPRKTKAERAAIRAHVETIAGLSGTERREIETLLITPGPAVDLPEFNQPDAAQRFGGFADDGPTDTRWFNALLQRFQGLTPEASDLLDASPQLPPEQRDELILCHAFARYTAVLLLERFGMRPADADACRAVLAWYRRADRLKHRIAADQLRLVVWYAVRFKRCPLDLSERVSVFIVALLRAIERYDPRRGAFSTCATTYMGRALSKETHTRRRLNAGQVFESDCVRPEGSPGLLSIAVSADARPDELHMDLAGFLAEPGLLTPTERRVLSGRYGIALGSDFDTPNGETLTLEDIGQVMGLTSERVRQVETAALEKLRCRFAGRPIPTSPKALNALARRRKRGQLDGLDPLDDIAPTGRENNTIGQRYSTL